MQRATEFGSERILAPAVMRGVAAVLSKANRSLRNLGPLIDLTGLDGRVADLSAEVPLMARVFDRVAEVIDDDCAGLRIAAEIDPRNFGALGYLGLASMNLGDALNNLARYHAVTKAPTYYEIQTNRAFTRVVRHVADAEVRNHRQVNEFAAACLVHCYRFFTGVAVRPVEVQFVHSRAQHANAIAKYFGCPVVYRAPHNALALHAQDLLIPVPTGDARLLHILRGYCEAIIGPRRGAKLNLRQQVEAVLSTSMSKGQTTIAHVARELGVSSRTLSRRLADNGTSFSKVQGDLRKKLAIHYVRSNEVALSEAAFLLGYSEVSAFNHAFKRWTGFSPQKFAKMD